MRLGSQLLVKILASLLGRQKLDLLLEKRVSFSLFQALGFVLIPFTLIAVSSAFIFDPYSMGFFLTLVVTFVLIIATTSLLLFRRSRLELDKLSNVWEESLGLKRKAEELANAGKVASSLMAVGANKDATSVINKLGIWDRFSYTELRNLYHANLKVSNIESARNALEVMVERRKVPSDQMKLSLLQSKIGFLKKAKFSNFSQDASLLPPANRDTVVHLVGKSILHHINGYTVRTHEIAKAQVEAGLSVHVICQIGPHAREDRNYTQKDLDGVTYHVIKGSDQNKTELDIWIEHSVTVIKAVLEHIQPAVLHAHSDFINASIALKLREFSGTPVVYEIRGFWEETLFSKLLLREGWNRDGLSYGKRFGLPEEYVLRKKIEATCREEADAVVTLGKTMADHIIQEGLNPGKLFMVPNGVDSQFHVSKKTQDREEILFDLPEDAIVFGTVGSLVSYEGIDDALSAFSTLEAEDERYWLLIVGDGQERQTLEDKAKSLKLSRVVFTGNIPRDNIPFVLEKIDIYLIPRKNLPVTNLVSPLKPIEAIAAGCSLIVSDLPPLVEFSHEFENVYIAQPEQPDRLAELMNSVAQDLTYQTDSKKRNKIRAQKKFGWKSLISEYVKLYRSLDVTIR